MAPERRLAVIGAGRAAATLARALRDRGTTVVAITCRRPAAAATAATFLGGAPVAASNPDAAGAGDVVVIGVPDGAIAGVAAELAAAGVDLTGKVVLHLAGSLDAEALAPLRAGGAAIGSLHPLQTFPERVEEPRYLAGVTFAIEGDPVAVTVAEQLVRALDGRPLRLAPGTKALYHAAASVASNHLTAVVDLALRLLGRAGVSDRTAAMEALLPLILTTLSGIEERGTERALTGPVVRGDARTLTRHLAGLAGDDAAVYRVLTRSTLELAWRGRRLDPAASRSVEQALAERPALVVASLRGPTAADLVRRAEESGAADLVEHRLDLLEESPPADLAPLAGPRSILTCRPGPRLGRGDAHALLARALGAGSAYVDVGLDEEGPSLLPAERLVLSWHGPAEGAAAAAARIAARRPAVGKVVIEATLPTDLLRLPDLARILRGGCREVVVLAGGEAGSASRVLARRLGSDWTYACLRTTEATAPGQIPLELLLAGYQIRAVTAASPVFALAGQPIAHSLSPAFHNPLLREALPGAVYVLLPTTDAAALLALVRALPIAGLSVTMPLKEAVARGCDELSTEAEATASVNTVIRRGSRLRGENTDVEGIAAAAAAILPLAGAGVLVLGAGGAGRSAAFALSRRGARVTIAGRDPARAAAAAAALGVGWSERAEEVAWDLLVNATPVGMAPAIDATPFPPERLDQGEGRGVMDLVYEPRRTRLVHEATSRGFAVVTGLDVLLAQGRAQLRLFTGRDFALGRLRAALAGSGS